MVTPEEVWTLMLDMFTPDTHTVLGFSEAW